MHLKQKYSHEYNIYKDAQNFPDERKCTSNVGDYQQCYLVFRRDLITLGLYVEMVRMDK